MLVDTRTTLLERVCGGDDPVVWDEFFHRYWPFIFSVARRRGCSEHTAEEIVQEVMLAIFERKAVFRHDRALGRFRDWLGGVVRNKIAQRRRLPSERARAAGGSDDKISELASSDDSHEAEWNAAFEHAMLAFLLETVRREVHPRTFQAFEAFAVGGCSGAEAARLTGLTPNAVYQARKNVLARLRELGAEYGDQGPPDELIIAEGSSYRPATLDNLLSAGPLSADDCQRVARQLLAALSCLHGAGMVHRDVKPANCLFVGGELKLADFGLLTLAGPSASRLGTLRYMPPDGCMDARADVYAAGLVIYEMLTGQSAECFPSLGERARAVAGDCRLAALNRLALRACDPDPQRRFHDASEMSAALGKGEKPPAKPRRRVALAILAVIAVIAALVACWYGASDTAQISVNFVSDPYEAAIYVDGRLLCTSDGRAYRTPCTVAGLPDGEHHVVFQWDAGENPFDAPAPGPIDLGVVDFGRNRQISVRTAGQ